jgi:hypothetical protein
MSEEPSDLRHPEYKIGELSSILNKDEGEMKS